MQDECSVRKPLIPRVVEAALPGPRDEAFQVKLIVDCIGAAPAWVKL